MKTYAYIVGALLIGGAFAIDVYAYDTSSVAAAPARHAKSLAMAGTVVSIDVVGNTLIVEGRGKKKAQLTFAIPANAKITENKKAITLGDITTGVKVAVRYTKDHDTLTAFSVKVLSLKK